MVSLYKKSHFSPKLERNQEVVKQAEKSQPFKPNLKTENHEERLRPSPSVTDSQDTNNFKQSFKSNFTEDFNLGEETAR